MQPYGKRTHTATATIRAVLRQKRAAKKAARHKVKIDLKGKTDL